MIRELKDRYGQYEMEAQRARDRAGLCDGLFGMGNDPRKAPCHQSFYDAVGQWTEVFLKSGASAGDCEEAAVWILQAADLHREEPDVFWYLYAVQAHALSLIPRMEQEAAGKLMDWYAKAYPPKDRMPVQDKVYHALKKTARSKLW